MEVKCSCQHCEGHIAFESSDSGRTVACPHCGKPVMLFVPKTPVLLAVKRLVQSQLSRIKLTSRTLAIFFAFTTFCLASILVWEHCRQPLFEKVPIYQVATTTKYVPTGQWSPDRPVLVAEKIQVGENQRLTLKGWLTIIFLVMLALFCFGFFMRTPKQSSILDATDTQPTSRPPPPQTP
jgi:DNA-directed RNA polymerase subunit RPC12/RpoP